MIANLTDIVGNSARRESGLCNVGSMRFAWELARREFQRYATYRAATVAGLFTNTVFGFLRAAVLIAALRAAPSGRIGGYGTREALTYTWLTQSLLMVVAVWGWNDIALRVQTGDIATDLARPYGFLGWWLARDCGRAAYQMLARGIAPLVTGAVFYTLAFPSSAFRWVWFFFSIMLAVVVSFGLRFIVNLLVFWTLDWRGISMIHNVLMSVCSGMVVPVAFFPHAIASALRVLPWYQALQAPIDVFLGKGSTPTVLAVQALWAAATLLCARALLQIAQRRLVVQGG